MFIAVLFTTAKTGKKPRCPSVGGQTNYGTLKGILSLFSCQVMPDSSVTPWTVAHQATLSMGFPRQEYGSGLPFPSPGDLPDPADLLFGRWILYHGAIREAL